jgi:metallo-beta-lactamase family protein
MKLTFFGAAGTVTGSCHCLEANGKKILIDCGLQQGREERDNRELPFSPASIDYVVVTHAHIDHSGRIPLLTKQGFRGQIVATRLTGELLAIMLRDSAHIQESEAQWETRKAARAGRGPVDRCTPADAEAALRLIQTYNTASFLGQGSACASRRRHLLAPPRELWVKEGETTQALVFGDIGNVD